jgi:hypothetical protein
MELYADATEKLSGAVSRLSEAAVSFDPDAFDRAWESCEEVRVLCSDIREKIYDHLGAHHCALELAPVAEFRRRA